MELEKLMVNGALMDKEYFEGNVEEAKSLEWSEINMSDIADHSHCIVCTTALPNSERIVASKAKSLFLCDYCWTEYVNA